MKKIYESPVIERIGEFAQRTGEWFGPYTEYVLFLRDWSYEG